MTLQPPLKEHTIALLQALSAAADQHRPEAEALDALAGAILTSTCSTSLDVWLEEGGRTWRWGFPGQTEGAESQSPTPSPAPIHGSGNLAERIARTMKLEGSVARSLTGSLWSPREVLIPFRTPDGAAGALHLRRNSSHAFQDFEIDSVEAIASAVGSTLANRRTHAALIERIKELSCVYQIAQVTAEPGSITEAIEQIVGFLPPAWQHPESTTARIRIADQIFKSSEFSEGPHVLRAPIRSGGEDVGSVEVFHKGEQALAPFLPEEQHLIDAVAREVSSLIERRTAEADRARLRDQLRHSDRLATIGQLAAGVAHEINEPLASVLGFAQLAVKAPELSDSTRDDLERIIKASLHAREIIRNLLVFSRQSPTRRVEVDIEEALRQAVSLIEARCAKASVELSLNFAGSLPLIQGDPSQLQQVFMNLLVNAIQSMPDGGQLVITTETDGRQITIQIQDTGSGIDPEHVEQIFLPFFTTKDIGEGTGLGLSVVHGIVAAHHGAVGVTTQPGRGTCFEVVLPTRTLKAGDSSE